MIIICKMNFDTPIQIEIVHIFQRNNLWSCAYAYTFRYGIYVNMLEAYKFSAHADCQFRRILILHRFWNFQNWHPHIQFGIYFLYLSFSLSLFISLFSSFIILSSLFLIFHLPCSSMWFIFARIWIYANVNIFQSK